VPEGHANGWRGAEASEPADDLFSIPPECIEVVPPFDVVPLSAQQQPAGQGGNGHGFVSMFRGCAPYIASHRGHIFVVHIPGYMLDRPVFPSLMEDLSVLWILGVKLVLVCGCREQVDTRLRQMAMPVQFVGETRITNEDTLRVVKEQGGYVRTEVESYLARGVGLTNSQVPVASSNRFYTANPVGIPRNWGINFEKTGKVRKIDSRAIEQHLDQGEVVLLTSLGYSPSGDVFNTMSDQLAVSAARELRASKIIFLTEGFQFRDGREGQRQGRERRIQSLRLEDAKGLLQHYNVSLSLGAPDILPATLGGPDLELLGAPLVADCKTSDGQALTKGLKYCQLCVNALDKGEVDRAHLVNAYDGALLQELYTRDGSGLLISRDLYEGIRRAQPRDVRGILKLIQPLIDEGILTKRTRADIELEIESYHVLIRDEGIIGVAQLRLFENGFGELACLAIHPKYRRIGKGESMLSFIERLSVQKQIKTLFCLSTNTMQWFKERGFVEGSVEDLPPSRQKEYSWGRRSMVYLKKITDSRAVDEEELLWDVLTDTAALQRR